MQNMSHDMNDEINENMNDNDIAVIGFSGRFPEADDLETFWKNLASGKDSIRPLPDVRKQELEEAMGAPLEGEFLKSGYLDTITGFEPGYFNISEEESKYIDPQHRLALELVEEAVQDAGYSSENMSRHTVGVFMALSKNVYGTLTGSSPMGLTNSLESALAGRIAYTFNFCGPAITVDTACSSSLTTLHYARSSLLNNDCDFAVTGGVRANLQPPHISSLKNSPITSKKQNLRAFDKDADGTLGGEGGGMLVLKKLKKALADGDPIHAIIKGSCINSDGRRSTGISAPNQVAQSELISKALDTAGLDPLSISYIEAHGTGTTLGDPIEVEGITHAFKKYTDRKQFISLGSVKTNIGHLDCAAGVAGVIKVILALKNRKIPPSLYFETPNPHIDFIHSPVYVADRLMDWQPTGDSDIRRAGVTSLGLTGTNVHTLLEEAPQPAALETKEPYHINTFTLSARTPFSLNGMMERLKNHLETNPGLSPSNVAYTLNTGRKHLPLRAAFYARTLDELKDNLQPLDMEKSRAGEGNTYFQANQGAGTRRSSKQAFSPVFIFPDLREEKALPVEALRCFPVFKEHYDLCLAAGAAGSGDDKAVSVFAFQYACARQMEALGIKTKAVFGIGAGRFPADVIQGIRTLEQGIQDALKFTEPPKTVEPAKLDKLIRQMIGKKYDLFLDFGGASFLEQNIAGQPEALVYVPVDSSEAALNKALCNLYANGAQLQWDTLYSPAGGETGDTGNNGQSVRHFRRVSLPPYVFDRKSYFIGGAGAGSPRRKKADGKGAEETEPKTVLTEPITFEDILAVFRSTVPYDLDLNCDFEENGGDSISVMEVVEILKKRFGTSVEIDLFYTIPTLNELIEIITQRLESHRLAASEAGAGEDGEKPSVASAAASGPERSAGPPLPELDPSVISLQEVKPKNILLTGSTGFLGSHLVNALLEKSNARVFCLTRPRGEMGAQERSREAWRFYFGEGLEPHFGKRIHFLDGDILDARLGLESAEYDRLAGEIDTVVHSAADVRHYGKYEQFKKINVDGTRHILDFCVSGNLKRLHHVSTLAITGTPPGPIIYRENQMDVGQHFEGQVYPQTKFEAELLVEGARKKGLQAAIYRIGNLVGRFEDGVFQENIDTNTLYNQVKGLAMLGKIPSAAVEHGRIEMTPIDLCSEAMVRLFGLRDAAGWNWHMMNPVYVTFREVVTAMSAVGKNIDVVDFKAFEAHINQVVQGGGFSKEISRIFIHMGGDVADREAGPGGVAHNSDFTVGVLEQAGFKWPQLGVPFLEKMLKHCADVGYF